MNTWNLAAFVFVVLQVPILAELANEVEHLNGLHQYLKEKGLLFPVIADNIRNGPDGIQFVNAKLAERFVESTALAFAAFYCFKQGRRV